jgi:hypothetical protein
MGKARSARPPAFGSPEHLMLPRNERGRMPNADGAAIEHLVNEWAAVARAIILRRRARGR